MSIRKKKKILMLVKHFYPKVGGVEKHTFYLTKELVKKGYTVTILTSNPVKSEKLPPDIKNKINVEYVKTTEEKYLGLMLIWLQVISKFKMFISSDIVHVHDVMIWVAPLRIFLFWKKFYLTMHGWEGIYPIPKKNIFLKKISVLLSSGTIAVGRYIDKYYKVKSDIYIYGATTSTSRETAKKRKKIVYLGRLELDNGVDVVVKCLEKYKKNWEIVFVGDGSLRNQCKKVGKVTGFVKKPEKFTSDTSIVIASGYLSVIECLARGITVVVMPTNKLKEDYFKLSPYSKFVQTIKNRHDFDDFIADFENRHDFYQDLSQRASIWANLQSWQKLSQQYFIIWNLK